MLVFKYLLMNLRGFYIVGNVSVYYQKRELIQGNHRVNSIFFFTESKDHKIECYIIYWVKN